MACPQGLTSNGQGGCYDPQTGYTQGEVADVASTSTKSDAETNQDAYEQNVAYNAAHGVDAYGNPLPAAKETTATTTGPSVAPTATTGGGGGGGGGGNSGAGGIGGPLGDQYSVQKQLMDELSKAMSGQSSRYNEANMQDLYAGVISDAESGRQATQQSDYADLAARGLLRSAAATPLLQTAGATAQKLRSEGLRKIRVEKITADYEDKMAAIDRSQKNLDSLRSYEVGKEANQAQFAQASATIAAASIRAEADKAMLTTNLAHDDEARAHSEQKASESLDSCRDWYNSVDPSSMGNCGF